MSARDRTKQDGTFESLSKENFKLRGSEPNLKKSWIHLQMTRLPGAILLLTLEEPIAVKEAQKLNIPIFAMVDTNCDPREVDFPIPSNDDASKSINLILKHISSSIKDGLSAREKEKETEKAIEEKEDSSKNKADVNNEDESKSKINVDSDTEKSENNEKKKRVRKKINKKEE